MVDVVVSKPLPIITIRFVTVCSDVSLYALSSNKVSPGDTEDIAALIDAKFIPVTDEGPIL